MATLNDNATNPAAYCALCGNPNYCEMTKPVTEQSACWCMRTVIPEGLLNQVPEAKRGVACICKDCIENFQKHNTGS